ncbi:hypothetical protein QR680_017917 [Steinernema hermaphroditum]|uniref:Uncharacterized protein n=1 Tax=Steinernema hermaphroditum TaxID=289476 RepID=A0AA39HGA2_9BILA|nr:hypothetical protein QR680_017917 [Steinernema hermaphroditum]
MDPDRPMKLETLYDYRKDIIVLHLMPGAFLLMKTVFLGVSLPLNIGTFKNMLFPDEAEKTFISSSLYMQCLYYLFFSLLSLEALAFGTAIFGNYLTRTSLCFKRIFYSLVALYFVSIHRSLPNDATAQEKRTWKTVVGFCSLVVISTYFTFLLLDSVFAQRLYPQRASKEVATYAKFLRETDREDQKNSSKRALLWTVCGIALTTTTVIALLRVSE